MLQIIYTTVFRVKQLSDFTFRVQLFSGAIQGVRTRRVPPLKLEKNMIFWGKIVIFHTKHPKNFRASLRSAQFF